MEDADTIVILEALTDLAGQAFRLPHNQPYSLLPPDIAESSWSSRETTPAAHVKDVRSLHNAQLRLTFSHKPKVAERGYVFGSSRRLCDVYLGNLNSCSRQHFAIRFDDQRRLVLVDTSKFGTTVMYGKEFEDQKRANFTWILFPRTDITVWITEAFRVRVHLPSHDFCLEQYQQRVSAFLLAAEQAFDGMLLLNFQSQQTTAEPSQPRSPGGRRLYWMKKELGSGTNGAVHEAVDVSTGRVFAAKVFRDRPQGVGEASILRRISHKHIVQYVHFTDEVRPTLIMECLPLRDLRTQHQEAMVTIDETVVLLQQALAALQHLHAAGVVHRDLKPENILLQSRSPLHIKLADFGLAKDAKHLKTLCGTLPYVAPEIWQKEVYTAAVDIWSIGVITFEFGYHLLENPMDPDSRKRTLSKLKIEYQHWYKMLAEVIEDCESDDLIDLLSTGMLKVDPWERLSAAECLRRALKLQVGVPSDPHMTGGGMLAHKTLVTSDPPESAHHKASYGHAPSRSRRQKDQVPWEPVHSVSEIHRKAAQQPELSASPSGPQPKRFKKVRDPQRAGFFQIEVNNKTVMVRKEDFFVNATDITKAAGRNRNTTVKLRKRGGVFDVVRGPYQGTYLNLQDSITLCEKYDLDELKKRLEVTAAEHGYCV